MKLQINKTYILGIVAFCGLFTACSKEDPTLFDGESDGFYFNYDNKDDLTSTINFADSVVKEPAVGYVPIKIRLLGHLSDQVTSITLKTEPVEGYDEAQVTLPKVELKAGEYDTTVNVTVARPTQEGKVYAVKVSFEQGDKSMKDFDSFVIYSKEIYEKPSGWDDDVYGSWTESKYKLIAKAVGKANFCDDRNDVQWNEYNPTAVAAVRAWHEEHPDETIPYDIPFLDGNYLYYGSYDMPSYWGDLQTKYLGEYDSNRFAALASGLGVTTQNEGEVLGSTDEAVMKNANKSAVRSMMENLNNTFLQGGQYDQFNSASTVPMLSEVDYDIVEPEWWTNSQTSSMIEKYYGTYSAAKYKRMIQIAMEKKGADFKLFLMFPVCLYYDYETYEYIPQWLSWDIFDENWNWLGSYYGEDVIYEYYQMFKKAEPSMFPDVSAPDTGYAKKRRK